MQDTNERAVFWSMVVAALSAGLVVGCGDSRGTDEDGDAGTDAPADTAADTALDTATDTLADTATDSTGGCTVFPADNPWNTRIDDPVAFPVHEDSDAIIASIGAGGHLHPDFGTVWEGAPIGIPYMVVTPSQPRLTVEFMYDDESDHVGYPVPADPLIEGGPDSDGDRHILMIDHETCMLYELYWAWPPGVGENPSADTWYAGSGAVFDLASNALRPDYWTSADAAGLPVFPGLVTYEEAVEEGVIDHALRFTVNQSRAAFIHPATHFASSDTSADLPPMGLRLRLRAGFDKSGFPAEVQVILTALERYGMIVADNGSDWYISGAPDSRWSDDNLSEIAAVSGSDFEVVYTGEPVY